MWFHEHGDALERLGVTPSRGALLYGPPGTGKTMLARAVATEANVPFYPLSISELLDAQIGESERAISRVFHEAKRLAPCILFLDECDALFGSRDSGGNLGKKVGLARHPCPLPPSIQMSSTHPPILTDGHSADARVGWPGWVGPPGGRPVCDKPPRGPGWGPDAGRKA
jgi:hypothetical protein